MKIANRLHVFCSKDRKGIEFIIPEIDDSVELAEGNFLCMDFNANIDWDNHKNYLSQNVTIHTGGHSYKLKTIMVDKKTLEHLFEQINKTQIDEKTGFYSFSLNKPEITAKR